MICEGGCGLMLVPSEYSHGLLMHDCRSVRDVLVALRCPLFGATPSEAQRARMKRRVLGPEMDADNVPALWRTVGHWNAVWRRSP